VRRFVADSAPAVLVERAAATFTRTGGDIREMLRTIVTSPEFFSRTAYRAKIKSPFELVVSALRAVDAQPDTTPRTARIVARLGEPLYEHQAPNGYPETGGAWITSGAILNRINFGLAVAGGQVPGASLAGWSELQRLTSVPRGEQVDGVVKAILGGDASPSTRRVLESGVSPVPATTPTAAGTPGPAARADGLARIVGLALGAPEFQRR
jgi:hypothetical protein